MRHKFVTLAVMAVLLAPMAAFAQQTGSLVGRVVDGTGLALPGVTVEATSPSLPSARVAVTGANGDYRMAALPPGTYAMSFTLSGMQTVTRNAQVQLGQDTAVNVTLSVSGVAETVTVTATTTYVDTSTATIKSGVSATQIAALPVGQEYRDLIRLIPGVQFTADQVRGPSAGGSGQDNVYQFDGVNVTLPLFGTLSAEPSSHDIAQVTTVAHGRSTSTGRVDSPSTPSASRAPAGSLVNSATSYRRRACRQTART
ncbi:MAG: carboxypeptidase-like regulatory domain-containing protein [Acidobacteria bacterium]|nr:carboxypeptidase-like regulatory domain-containing protein [Acidobacteriota bacterium]